MKKEELALRRAIIEACREMNTLGINQGTSGNISARFGDAMLITPTGVPYDELDPGDLARMPIEGRGASDGPLEASSEWRFHLDIMKSRPEVGAVVHAHSPYATAFAICNREIPACHYMIAAAGGPSIRVAPYATYGTAELSRHALAALEGRTCCLLANHGLIATGATLKRAMWLAVELETLARQYHLALAIGQPQILPDAEIAHVIDRFKEYGPRPKAAAAASRPARRAGPRRPRRR
jgi:L-fuculose-phosphate aldolase